MAAIRITKRDVALMVQHWLKCPPNGYLGSRYGSDMKSLLHTPMAAGLADGLIAKCRQDIPLLLTAPSGMLNIYSYDEDLDRKVIKFEVAGELLDVDGTKFAVAADEQAVVEPTEALIDTIGVSASNLLNTTVNNTMPDDGYW